MNSMAHLSPLHLFAFLVVSLAAGLPPSRAEAVRLSASENGGAVPVGFRARITGPGGKIVVPSGFPAWNDQFSCSGEAQFDLPPGNYRLRIERGPEYSEVEDTWKIEEGKAASFHYQITRIADLAHEGWWSGELHIHRPLNDIETLMRSEDLHVAPVITWWNTHNLWAAQKPTGPLVVPFDGDRYYSIMAGEDERSGGALLYFGLNAPLPLATSLSPGPEQGEYPPQMRFLTMARKEPGAWVDIEKPFWYDVPLWLASGMVDSVEIAHNHMDQGGMIDNEAWGRARNRAQFPSPWGNGLWTQEIYYRILNCGLRLPPSAGSASGVLPNPVGYNRVYVHTENGLSYDAWWDGLRAGRSFVTNGPLLRVKADGRLPGYIFKGEDGKTLSIGLEAALDSRDPMERIEIIKNGSVEKTIPASEWVRDGSLGTLRFSESGWFLVRAIASVPGTFRFASTAPFYVEIGSVPVRISRASAQFFMDWLHERSSLIQLSDALQKAEVLKYYSEAERYWRTKVLQANAN